MTRALSTVFLAGLISFVVALTLLTLETFACAPYQPCNVVGGTAAPVTSFNTTTSPIRNIPSAGRNFGSTSFGTNTPVRSYPARSPITTANVACPPYAACNAVGGSPYRRPTYNYNRQLYYGGYYGNYNRPLYFNNGRYRYGYNNRGYWNYTNYGRHHVTSIGSNGFYYSNWGRNFNFSIGL